MKTCVVVGIVASTMFGGLAVADRATADKLAKEAHATKDPTTAAACGQAYLDVYNKTPDDPANDEVLYAAAVCLEEARSIGAAVQAIEALRKYHPTSKFAARATLLSADLYARVATHDRAAERFEEYAKKYAGEPDAPDALASAIQLRVAFGIDDDRAIADAALYAKTFGAKRPTEAAQLMLGITDVVERKGPDALVAHLQDYLRTYARGDLAGQVAASARIGELLWHRACPAKEQDGLCVQVTRERARPVSKLAVRPPKVRAECDPDASTKVVAVARTDAKVKEALTFLTMATKAYEASPSTDPGLRAVHARVQLVQADRELEAFLAVAFPTGLDFTKKKDPSLQKFKAYVATRSKLGGAAQARYEAVFAIKDPTATIAAVARLGQLAQTFADQLLGAQIPVDLRTGELARISSEAFCDKMAEVAEPMAKRAKDAFTMCVAKSTELGLDTASTRVCLRELARIDPTHAPSTAEVLPAVPLPLALALESVANVASAPAAYTAALGKYREAARAGFNATSCTAVSAQLGAVAKASPTLAEAHYLVGLVAHACGRVDDAAKAYAQALQVKPAFPLAQSNLAVIWARAGKLAEAKAAWSQALAADGKLFGARVNLAALAIVELRALGPAARAKSKLASDVEFGVRSALAVADGSPLADVQFALLELARDQPQRAAAYYRRAALHGEREPAVAFVGALLAVDEPQTMFMRLEAALKLDPTSTDLRFALVLTQLRVRRYDQALGELRKLPSTYEVNLAIGVALGGEQKYADAVVAYEKAIALDGTRPEAPYDLALAQEQLSYLAADLPATRAALVVARESYAKALALARPAIGEAGAIAAEAKRRGDLVIKAIATVDTLPP